MKKTTIILALLLVSAVAVSLLASCGADKEDAFSNALSRTHVAPPADKSLAEFPSGSFEELPATEFLGLSLQVKGAVRAGAETVPFSLSNEGVKQFVHKYDDILLQKKTADGWVTYRRTGEVPEVGIIVPVGGSANERVKPEQYGVELKSGETYRILIGTAPEAFGEFTVQ